MLMSSFAFQSILLLFLAQFSVIIAQPLNTTSETVQSQALLEDSVADGSPYLFSVDIFSGDVTTELSFKSNNSLEARADWDTCYQNTKSFCKSPVTVFGATAAGVAASWAGIIYSWSQSHRCQSSLGNTRGVYWKLAATGRNCDTTAQKSTIQGGIEKALKETAGDGNLQLCTAQCIHMDHGGTYTVYGAIGSDQQAVNNIQCNPDTKYGTCVKGGKNDI